MTSKEALEILFASYYYDGNYQQVIEAREKLEQELERLEKLEKAIELFKDKFSLDLENNGELHFDFGDYKEREASVYYTEFYHELTIEEYKLLKEVLKNA